MFKKLNTFFREILIAFLRGFLKKKDPLDELLEEKGIDPDKLMDDVRTEREMEGNSSAVNRVLDRWDRKKDKIIKSRKKTIIPGKFW